MPRALAFALLACVAATAWAVDTPLTLNYSSKVVVIDPVFGSISVYDVNSSSANRVGLGKPSGNFVNEIERMLKTPIDAKGDGEPVPQLRLGSLNCKPGYGDFFRPGNAMLPDKATPSEAAAGKAAVMLRAYKGEDAFWKGKVAYDGVVRAALSSTGGYLGLAIPSLHTLMVYKLDSDTASLAAFANWGPTLFIPTGLNTTPDPASLVRQLPQDKQKQFADAIGLDDGAKPAGGAAPAGLGAAAEEPPTPKSEVWLGAAPNDAFMVVDTANQRVLLYQFNGKNLTLNAVRNIKPDLLIAGLSGGGWNSAPFGDTLLKQYVGSRKRQLAEYNLPSDMDGILALVQQHQGASAGKASEFEGAFSGSVAFLNFVKDRAFLAVDASGGQALKAVAARDTTIDIAVGLLDQEINNRIDAANKLPLVFQSVGQPKSALLLLRYVLSLDPNLWKPADARLKNAFKGEDKTEYQAIIDGAKAKAAELAQQAEDRRKAAEDAKKKRTGG